MTINVNEKPSSPKPQAELKGQKPTVKMLDTDLTKCTHDHETEVCPRCDQKPIIMRLPIKDTSGKGRRFKGEVPIDFCIADLVRCLNAKGIDTKSSCCGHGAEYGSIELMDGRELIVKRAKVAEKKPITKLECVVLQ